MPSKALPVEVNFSKPLPVEARDLLRDPSLGKVYGLGLQVLGSRTLIVAPKRAMTSDTLHRKAQLLLLRWMADYSQRNETTFRPIYEVETHYKGITIQRATINFESVGGGIALSDANALVRFLQGLSYVASAKLDRLDTTVDAIRVEFHDSTSMCVIRADVHGFFDDNQRSDVEISIRHYL